MYQVLLNVVATTILGLRNARAIFEANTCHHAIISFTFDNSMLQSKKSFAYCLYCLFICINIEFLRAFRIQYYIKLKTFPDKNHKLSLRQYIKEEIFQSNRMILD